MPRHGSKTACPRWLLMVCATLLMGGCAHVNYLRDAQDTFNQTAALENGYKLDPQAQLATGTPIAINTGYVSVITSLNKLEQDSDTVSKLRADNLYGNVLSLKAIAYWRLQKYDEAQAAAKAALQEGIEPGSRDYAFVLALPGLIRNDQAYAKIYSPTAGEAAKPKQDQLQDVEALLDSAQQTLDDSSRSLPTQHPMHQYLALSTLAIVKNMADACLKFTTGTGQASQCVDSRKIDCRAQLYAWKAKEQGAAESAILSVGQGVLRQMPAAAPPACT